MQLALQRRVVLILRQQRFAVGDVFLAETEAGRESVHGWWVDGGDGVAVGGSAGVVVETGRNTEFVMNRKFAAVTCRGEAAAATGRIVKVTTQRRITSQTRAKLTAAAGGGTAEFKIKCMW